MELGLVGVLFFRFVFRYLRLVVLISSWLFRVYEEWVFLVMEVGFFNGIYSWLEVIIKEVKIMSLIFVLDSFVFFLFS